MHFERHKLSVGIHEVLMGCWPYWVIGSMTSHLEVFIESFTANQKMDWSMTSFLILNFFFKQRSPHFMFWKQTCQHLTKENLETHEKKSGDSTKSRDILFFPDQD